MVPRCSRRPHSWGPVQGSFRNHQRPCDFSCMAIRGAPNLLQAGQVLPSLKPRKARHQEVLSQGDGMRRATVLVMKASGRMLSGQRHAKDPGRTGQFKTHLMDTPSTNLSLLVAYHIAFLNPEGRVSDHATKICFRIKRNQCPAEGMTCPVPRLYLS